jgi:hypothetical protein
MNSGAQRADLRLRLYCRSCRGFHLWLIFDTLHCLTPSCVTFVSRHTLQAPAVSFAGPDLPTYVELVRT